MCTDMSQLGEIIPSTANAIWIGTALLHQENKTREAFLTKEIFEKVKNMWRLSVSDDTITMHITSHCVANSYANPDRHRKLYRVDKGMYRLFRRGDLYDKSREGGPINPVTESIPSQYKGLIDWYDKEYCDQPNTRSLQITNRSVAPDFERITNGMIHIPPSVFTRLGLREGDYVAFFENTKNTLTFKKANVDYKI